MSKHFITSKITIFFVFTFFYLNCNSQINYNLNTKYSCTTFYDSTTKLIITNNPQIAATSNCEPCLDKIIFEKIKDSLSEMQIQTIINNSRFSISLIIDSTGKIINSSIIHDKTGGIIGKIIIEEYKKIKWYPACCNGNEFNSIYFKSMRVCFADE